MRRMSAKAHRDAPASPPRSPWTPREAELLAITLRLLQQHGYEGLTVEAVATEAKSSKATVYKRWPTKANLAVAAFIEGTRVFAVAPRTGSLREDLLAVGASACRDALEHADTMRAVLTEVARNPAMKAAIQDDFVRPRKLIMDEIIAAAVQRGEIDAAVVINEEMFDLLPGYLAFRAVIAEHPATAETVRMLVDDVLIPTLTGNTRPASSKNSLSEGPKGKHERRGR
jgi:AcrR family transcriptional regulator